MSISACDCMRAVAQLERERERREPQVCHASRQLAASMRKAAKLHTERSDEGVWHGRRTAQRWHAACVRTMPMRAPQEYRASSPSTVGGPSRSQGGALSAVCKCGSGPYVESRAWRDRFTSHTSHSAHRSRSETPGSARDAESEECGQR